MNIAQLARARYATKAFDPDKKIPEALMDELRTLLRLSPSSVNSQPWHFIIASGAEGKARIGAATRPSYAYNEPKILNASHVAVLCVRTGLDEAHLAALIGQEERDGRFTAPEAKAGQDRGRRFYLGLHRNERGDERPWMEKQVYLALGMLLLGAAALGIDACPMEGFDAGALDAELGLADRGLASLVIVCLGYRGEGDYNAHLPKSRLPAGAVFTEL
ncbi:MAG TPA: oxygen-insensitive NAD(P)H nitroreductase [Spirochaetota bacterium]|nr:oxygen-insensitive NAD(P)H nitroreductase [Spirochaetota bacterium]HOD14795.1 oxygen-insensitive NAD(P)H nitroreductase [Spirochaetota bacterium]HPG50196.1 oxygen-insensitive NAD(P)H nitroreductase [Spirochaetota bacterium]HPN14124.1 oxygen-insensitive NAD(P)H nitroreductase [Spirochaetota bacterium]